MTTALLSILFTLLIYQSCAYVQRISAVALLNPMLLSILIIIPLLIFGDISFEQYNTGGQFLSYLLEPCVVALGFPLYEQARQLKKQWRMLLAIILLGAVVAITSSVLFAILLQLSQPVTVSLALKSITTPIALELSTAMGGVNALTALAIIFAGILGAVLGRPLLMLLGVTNPKAQGLAIGAGSHALGTATVSQISFEHGAYSSLALIFSAIFTAALCPWVISLAFA